MSTPTYAMPPHDPAVDPPTGTSTPLGTLWKIIYYDDKMSTHPLTITRPVCFVNTGVQGTNTVGYWYYDSLPSPGPLAGNYRQEGDQIFMVGFGQVRTPTGALVLGNYSSALWEMVSGPSTTVNPAEGFGHWEEWVKPAVDPHTMTGSPLWPMKTNIKTSRGGECKVIPTCTNCG